MTSKQVMLTVATLLAGLLVPTSGCEELQDLAGDVTDGLFPGPTREPLTSPYPTRHVWAIAPLRNESGTRQADGAVLADKLHQQLANAGNIEALPVNRTLEAMRALQLTEITSQVEAMQVMEKMGVDGLVVGTITAYDPFDPPKLGMTLELYSSAKTEQADRLDLRQLTVAPTMPPLPPSASAKQPVSAASAVLDAGDPSVRQQLQRYANRRGSVPDAEEWRKYRLSMDLYSEFASYVMCWRLLDAEKSRLNPLGDKSSARK